MSCNETRSMCSYTHCSAGLTCAPTRAGVIVCIEAPDWRTEDSGERTVVVAAVSLGVFAVLAVVIGYVHHKRAMRHWA